MLHSHQILNITNPKLEMQDLPELAEFSDWESSRIRYYQEQLCSSKNKAVMIRKEGGYDYVVRLARACREPHIFLCACGYS